MNRHQRTAYTALPTQDKEKYLHDLPDRFPDFQLDRIARFEALGQALDTAIYRYKDGAEFVFVPGGTVTLGWDHFAEGMDGDTLYEMTEALEEYGIDDLEGFLRDNCTPVRTATIPAMLVERHVREIGWYDVAPDHPAIAGNPRLQKYLADYQRKQEDGLVEVHNTIKLSRQNGELRTQLYEPVGWQELIRKTEAAGFGIPTEDEWEYLCGGGSRTLWRWGDSFDYSMKIPYFDTAAAYTLCSDIQDPNGFGLVIAFDPYVQEVVSGPDTILKAGDGGCNICGGAGIAMGFLPVATYFKGTSKEEDSLDYLEDIGGDYTSYRRIIRLG